MTITTTIQADGGASVEGLTVTVRIKGRPRKARPQLVETEGYCPDDHAGSIIDLETRRAS